MLAIDECHLYANFGIEFRSEFYLLRQFVLDKLSGCLTHNIVVLFMTATATKGMGEDLEFLTGLSFDKVKDVLWPSDLEAVKRRNVGLRMNIDNSPLRRIKFFIRVLETALLKEKIIVYTNSLKRLHRLIESVRGYLDDEEREGDVVTVNGSLLITSQLIFTPPHPFSPAYIPETRACNVSLFLHRPSNHRFVPCLLPSAGDA